MRISIFLLFSTIIFSETKSQNLPAQWRKTDNGQMLIAGDQMDKGLYDESVVEEVRLYFPQSNYWNLLTQYYNSKTDIPATLKYKVEFNGLVLKEGVSFVSAYRNNDMKNIYLVSESQYKKFIPNTQLDILADNLDFDADLLSGTVGGVWTQSVIHGTGLVAASGEY